VVLLYSRSSHSVSHLLKRWLCKGWRSERAVQLVLLEGWGVPHQCRFLLKDRANQGQWAAGGIQGLSSSQAVLANTHLLQRCAVSVLLLGLVHPDKAQQPEDSAQPELHIGCQGEEEGVAQ
jgi:hypothetical protein